MYAFLCNIVSGRPVARAPHEISEVGWFDALALPGPLENDRPAGSSRQHGQLWDVLAKYNRSTPDEFVRES